MSATSEEIMLGFLHAARNGDVLKVQTFLRSYGLSYSAEWSDGYIFLCNALENGHPTVAEVLLDAGARVNNESGGRADTPLHYAAGKSFKDIVERLLSMGANVDAQGRYVSTPLHCAARQSNGEIVELLLRHGAAIDAFDEHGNTALHISVEKGNVPLTQILLNHGADVFCTTRRTYFKYTRGYTPLHTAAEKGFEEICKLLLSKGASVNAMSTNDETALHVATQNGHLNLVELFSRYGVETKATNYNGDTCLPVAAQGGGEDVVNALLANGFSVYVTKSEGVTPAFLALKEGRTNIVSLLLERGGDVNFQDKNGKTILWTAVEEQSGLFVDLVLKFPPDANNEHGNQREWKISARRGGNTFGIIIETILQCGFKAYLKVDNAKDMLHTAVEEGNFKLVEDMLKSCRDVVPLINATDDKGRTSLHVASEKRQEDIVELLIRLGADVNALTACTSVSTESRTPLFYSVKNNDINISKILLKNQAKANGCLMMAVLNINLAMVKLLLQHGADPNSKEKPEPGLLFWRSSDFEEERNSHDILRKWGMDVEGENRAGGLVLKTAIGTTTRNTKIVEILLKYGADVNEEAYLSTDKKYSVLRTPLMVAAKNGNANITTMLLDKGAALNVVLMPKKVTALHIAVLSKMSNVVDVLLKQPDIDFDYEDCEKKTPLHYAAKNGDIAIVTALLKRGAVVNCRDHLGKTPLHYTALWDYRAGLLFSRGQSVDIAKALLRSGADVNARDAVYGYTPLHYWAKNKNSQKEIFNFLLKYGADMNSRSKTEETPLFVAVKNRCESSVSVLLRNGADVNIKHVIINEDGRCGKSSTAFQKARSLEFEYLFISVDHVQCDDNRYLKMCDLFYRHMIMLDSAKFYVNARDRHSLDSCGVPVFDKYRKKCEEELSLLKLTKVVGNPKVSFNDFLTKSPNKLASLLKRENMAEIISSEKFRKDLGSFVIYGDLINNRIEIALRRGNVLKTASSCIGKMFSIPDLCADSICDYLTNFDLNNFVEACKESDCERESSSDRLMM